MSDEMDNYVHMLGGTGAKPEQRNSHTLLLGALCGHHLRDSSPVAILKIQVTCPCSRDLCQ